ncbi:MAG: nucleotidyltransferase [Candidatus Omnitrophota bacterium]
MLNEDYKEILQILLNNKVKFLIVGAYAMGAQGYPRATGDFDIWVEPSPENSKKVYNSLAEFGAPLGQINTETFIKKGIIFQIGVIPRRVDILTFINGVKFDKAYKDKENIKIEGITIPFLSKENIIKNKKATGREKDKLDVKYLRKNKNI